MNKGRQKGAAGESTTTTKCASRRNNRLQVANTREWGGTREGGPTRVTSIWGAGEETPGMRTNHVCLGECRIGHFFKMLTNNNAGTRREVRSHRLSTAPVECNY